MARELSHKVDVKQTRRARVFFCSEENTSVRLLECPSASPSTESINS